MIQKIFRWFYLGSRGYVLEQQVVIPASFAIGLGAQKLAHLIRGLLRFQRLIFVGRRTRITLRRQVRLGRRVVIGSDVGIHAFGGSGITIGSFTTIGDFATLQVSGVIREPGSHIRIGEHSSVGIRNFLHGGGGISIGNNCLLGPNVSIFSENHGFRNISKLIRDQQAERAEVVIGDNVWVGANSVILAGVAIGDGAVIAAGSVVTKHVDSNEVFGGVPAKKIGHRGE